MNITARGKLITLEGVEGAGKSSQLETIRQCVEAAGHTAITTREPGGTSLAESIRAVLLDGDDMPPMTELLLMFAARSSHFQEKIEPALNRGDWVICDRFIDASYAYQGAGRGLEAADINALERMTLQGCQPDQVLLFDLPVEAGLARAKSRGDENRFEKEDVAFMQRVRETYLERAAQEPARYAVINASADLQQVSQSVQTAVQRYIQNNE